MLFIDLFLWLIKMVIVLLVFSILMVGIMCFGEMVIIGWVGGKVMVWFIIFLVLFIFVGLVIVIFQYLGVGLNLVVLKEVVDIGLVVSGMSLKGFLLYIIFISIIEVMVNNEILQIVVFLMFFGIVGVLLGEKFNVLLVVVFNVVLYIMLKVMGYVMYVVLLVIFVVILLVIVFQGLGILFNYVLFIGGYYLVVLLISVVLIVVGYMVLKKEVFCLLNMLKDLVLVVFIISSLEVVYLKIFE